jgi:hypothetical protein
MNAPARRKGLGKKFNLEGGSSAIQIPRHTGSLTRLEGLPFRCRIAVCTRGAIAANEAASGDRRQFNEGRRRHRPRSAATNRASGGWPKMPSGVLEHLQLKEQI